MYPERMRRIGLFVALVASLAPADEVEDARARNDAFLKQQKERLAKIRAGDFVVVVGGDTLESGERLLPLLDKVDKSHPNAAHRYVFRRGQEGSRHAKRSLRPGRRVAGRMFFSQSDARMSHDGVHWIFELTDGTSLGRSAELPRVSIGIGGKFASYSVDPAAEAPLVSDDPRDRYPRYEIPGWASAVTRNGMDFEFRRYLVPTKLKNVDEPIFLELWGARDRAGNHRVQQGFQQIKGAPWEQAKQWSADALQLEDPELRERTLVALRDALKGDDQGRALAALKTVTAIRDLKYDKASFRDLILPHLDGSVAPVRIAAGYALYNTAREEGDLQRIIALGRDESTSAGSAAHLLFMYAEGDLTGEVGDAALALIRRGQGNVPSNVVRSYWGARVSPEIEAAVLEMAQDEGLRKDAIYFGLSTWREKSRRVCDELLVAAAEPNSENQWRAMWGLGFGVRPEDEQHVADGILKLLQARASPRTRLDCLGKLGRYGGERHVAAIEAVAANEQEADKVRAAAERAAAAIRTRKR